MLPPYWGMPKFPMALSWVPLILSGDATLRLFFSTTNRPIIDTGNNNPTNKLSNHLQTFIFPFSFSLFKTNYSLAQSHTLSAQLFLATTLVLLIISIINCDVILCSLIFYFFFLTAQLRQQPIPLFISILAQQIIHISLSSLLHCYYQSCKYSSLIYKILPMFFPCSAKININIH